MAAPKWVLLLGEFSSGKSAFINMLLGAAILPERLASTDLPVVKVSSRLTPGISLTYADKPRKALARWDQIPSDWRLFDYAEVTLSGHPLLDTGLVLWDTPGINATLPRHREHLERFLTDRAGGFHRVLYFVPNNISRTSLDFLQSWRALWPNLMIVVNVKESLPREACEALSREARKIVMRELGNIPVLTLAVGDACEAFVEACHKVTDNRSDGDRIRNWHTGQIDFGELLGRHADHIVGDELFEIVAETTPSPKALFDPAELSDARLKALAVNGDPSALLLYSEQLLKSGPGSTDLPYIKQAAMLDDPAAQLALGQALLDGQPGRKNVALAVKWLWEAAEQKSAKAQYLLGSCHEQGRGVPADMPTAIQWYRHAAEGGVPDAQHRLGQLYERGDGLPRDAGVAASWYQRASDQNHHGAQWAMGRLYESGEGVEQNLKQAVTCYDRAASGGYADAQYRLAQILLEGKLVRRNATRALPLLQAAAEQGLASAQFDLARSLEQGIGTQPDQAAAVRWYQAAAEQGHPEAQFYLAECYEAGVGIKQNIKEAMRWYQAASGQNHLESKFNLGRLLEQHGRSASALAEAAALYQTAAEQGHVDAQLRLAVFYAEGIGVGADSAKAVIWFRRAAETGCAEAQYRLAESLARGNGVARDDGEALRWYQRSADLGYAPAHYELGLRYHAGNGLPKDEARAAAHLRIAADAGIVNAQLWLGALLETSGGTAAEQAEAEQYYRRAAEQGLAEAQCRLATWLMRSGGGRAENDGVHWYAQAAEQNHPEAMFALGRLYEEGRGKLKQSYAEAARWYARAAELGQPGAETAFLNAKEQAQRQAKAKADEQEAQKALKAEQDRKRQEIKHQQKEAALRQADLDRKWALFRREVTEKKSRGINVTFMCSFSLFVSITFLIVWVVLEPHGVLFCLWPLFPAAAAVCALLTSSIFKFLFRKKIERLMRKGKNDYPPAVGYTAEVVYSNVISLLALALFVIFQWFLSRIDYSSSSQRSHSQKSVTESQSRDGQEQPTERDRRTVFEQAWSRAQETDTVESYTQFLTDYEQEPPAGVLIQQARARIAELQQAALQEQTRSSLVGMQFVRIPAGSFQMGSNQGDSDERPVHQGAISRPFYLQTTEVTQGQWQTVMGNNPSHFKNGDDYPVEQVSWNDVQAFLKKLNAMDPGKNYRLPTEAEWEYACRAGTTGERYGNLSDIAWYGGNSGNQTHPVGKKQPNAWGLYDMLGNVWEWCADWHDEGYYASSPSTDPRGPSSGSGRVVRGGSWFVNDNDTRIADRDRGFTVYGYFSYGLGFRCATDNDPTRETPIPDDSSGKNGTPATTGKERIAAIERAWSQAKAQDTIEAYTLFIAAHDQDSLAEDLKKQARARIAELQQQARQEAARQEAARQEAARQEAAKQEAARREQARTLLAGMRFVRIPAGSFKMGSKSERDEKPVHQVTISLPFYLQTTEVTQGQWRAVMGNNPSNFKNGDDYPVEKVSWNDVQAFLVKLNAMDPGKNYRLPTEAEWEYACRAGTTGERYGKLDAIAWYNKNSSGQTHPVGQKQPNAWGLYDMMGNVWEWCADWYGENYYANSPATDPRGPSSGSGRVLRGGSWYGDGTLTRSANRYWYITDYRNYYLGFRCAASEDPSPESTRRPNSSGPSRNGQEQPTGRERRTVIEQAWSRTRIQDTIEAYALFITEYDHEPQAEDLKGQARARIAELEQAARKEVARLEAARQEAARREVAKQEAAGQAQVRTLPAGMRFVRIPAGSFQMGSKKADQDERPLHRVNISRPFYLQTTEVTQGQWQAVMGNNPSHFKNGNDYPVEQVSWNDVLAFLKKLNAIDPGKNYRLPTEAEWEYACRAGTTGERYGELDAIAWYWKNSGNQTHPVGMKQPNAWGLYDMLGNVWEWCADWYGADYYASSPSTDPQGPQSGEGRVLRGGSWNGMDNLSRSAFRLRNDPGQQYYDIGLRCARD